jgi:uncharacterized damage-inducible protein DinB
MHPFSGIKLSKTLRFGCLRAAAATYFLFSLVPFFTAPARAQSDSRANNSQAQEPATTIASAVDHEISNAEKQIVEAAEAMPEDRYNFSPENLNITGGDYKGVRTFAQEVKHIAASNFAIWSPLTRDKLPKDYMGGNGPENLKTKAEIIQFLKDSFALGHKAAATLTLENMLQPAEGSKSTRLHLAEFAVSHAYDHYGQMVEYLRMNGIVPPASRPKSI